MSLPKIEYPIYSIEVPSLKKKFKFRPFLVKEEKLLLTAKESQEVSDILMAIKQIVNNCCVENDFNINDLAIFDLEYVFLKLRAVSVENITKIAYKDEEDGKTYNFDIDLNAVEVKYPEKAVGNMIKLTDKSGLIMKYPSASLYDDKNFMSLEKDYMFELIARCVESVYYVDEIYEFKNYSKKEIDEFLEGLSLKTLEEINTYLMNSPKIEHVITYKNEMGNEKKIVLNSLNDFFTWR